MSFQHISVSQTAALLQDDDTAVVADIRDVNSFQSGHIPGSERLSNENLGYFLNEKDYEQPIIVVCYHGISSQTAANYLVSQGFEQVYSMDGGFTAWGDEQADNIASGTA
jgi:thiosulfate sulfurtransferase